VQAGFDDRADISPDGSTVLVRTYRRVMAFTRPAGKPMAAAAKGADSFTISEGTGAAVRRFAVNLRSRPERGAELGGAQTRRPR
jgi:hypothetical protein